MRSQKVLVTTGLLLVAIISISPTTFAASTSPAPVAPAPSKAPETKAPAPVTSTAPANSPAPVVSKAPETPKPSSTASAQTSATPKPVVSSSAAQFNSSSLSPSSTPSSSPSSTPKPKASPNPSASAAAAEKAAALASARDAYTLATNNALQGFDRAVADAKAIRDQALLAAGTDKTARAAAMTEYKNEYSQIYQAFTAQILAAKQALAAAKSSIK
jgi:hypothetical protein